MKTILYLGTDLTFFKTEEKVIHFPIIELIPRSLEEVRPKLQQLVTFTHLIFTSKHAVFFFFKLLRNLAIDLEKIMKMTILAIGPSTAHALHQEGISHFILADEAIQEGIISRLKKMDLKKASILMPRSSQARPLLTQFLDDQQIDYEVLDIYDPMPTQIKPNFKLEEVDEIVFTSPSTVGAFFRIFDQIPKHVAVKTIGPITEEALQRKLKETNNL